MPLDFGQFQRMLAAAARESFAALRAAHPDETFYAFALYSSGGADGPSPAANTEEVYRRRVERRAERKGADPTAAAIYRWSTAEWGYEADGCEPFHPAWELLNAPGKYDASAPDGFRDFRVRVFGAMLGALRDLDAEGFFGAGPARDAVTLFCTISDGPDAVWLEQESARRLNPPGVYAAFEPGWRTAALAAYGERAFAFGEAHARFVRLFGAP